MWSYVRDLFVFLPADVVQVLGEPLNFDACNDVCFSNLYGIALPPDKSQMTELGGQGSHIIQETPSVNLFISPSHVRSDSIKKAVT